MRFDATKKPEATVTHKMLMKLNQKTIEQMKILFTSAHDVAKHGRPFSDFQWLCSLDEAKGLKVGTAYRNDKSCQDFMKAIATNQRNITLSLIEKAQFWSMVSDGSTDSSHREPKFVVRLAVHGAIFTKFVGLKNIGKANADGGTVKKTKDQIARPYILAVHCSAHHNDRINAILHNFKRPCQ